MPQAVAQAITQFIVTTFAVSASNAYYVYAVVTAATYLATPAALAKITESLIGVPKVNKQPADVEYTGTVEPRRIIYGEVLASGMNVIPPMTSGTTNEYLHQVLAIAGHECNQLGTVYFNREAIGTISAISGTDDDGKVTTGTYANKAWVRRYAGTSTQTVDYKLAAAKRRTHAL